MKQKKLSVIIPVKNGADTLGRCLSSVRNQTVEDIEIIILDSMSSDSSAAIAAEYGAVIIPVPDGTFNHGLTRNLGVANANGELVYLTVQDAWIADAGMFEKMIAHFEQEEIMGVSGHQAVPHEMDKNPLTWYKRFSEPVTVIRQLKDATGFDKMNHGAQQSLIAWDNVVAMYRKTALLQLQFADSQFAEDWIWSRDALLKGWKLIYDPSLVVFHYHHSSYSYAYKVAFAVNFHFYKYFNFKPGLSDLLIPMSKAIYHLGKHPELNLKEKVYWVYHNFLIKSGTFNSHLNFLFHNYLGGIKSVEKRYKKVCEEIPQGRQRHLIKNKK